MQTTYLSPGYNNIVQLTINGEKTPRRTNQLTKTKHATDSACKCLREE